MRQAAENRMVKGTTQNRAEVEPAVEESAHAAEAHAAESLKDRIARVRQLYPPADVECKACWLQGAERQAKAAKSGRFEAVAPPARDNQHCVKSCNAGAAAAREILTA